VDIHYVWELKSPFGWAILMVDQNGSKKEVATFTHSTIAAVKRHPGGIERAQKWAAKEMGYGKIPDEVFQ
jgi:hypothetical protein